ncbi:MAG: hypothetical protein L0154_15080 [Chloroflexi bacterium]|nr:hypothetical protein [Chloroflexota bacterium]
MKSTRMDAVVLVIVLIVGGAGVVIGWLSKTYGLLVVGSVLGVLILISLSDMLRAGFRPALRFERFEFRVLIQTIIIFLGGGAVVAAAYFFANIAWLPLLIVWLLLSGYSVRRMRGKSETAAAYRRRMGFKDEP